MGSGISKSGYFIFTHKGNIFESMYGNGKMQIFYFKRCYSKDGEIVIDEFGLYQMYVPLKTYDYTFDKEKIYGLSEVYEGKYKEDKSGSKNLSHHVVPKEYTKSEFLELKEKTKTVSAEDAKEFLQVVKEIEEQERKDLDKRLGRLS